MEFLGVDGKNIISESGQEIFLRGVCIGGWMNMEHFLNGYPGSENGMRRAMIMALGEEKAEFFFDKWMDLFFAEDDIRYLAECGVTVVRLPLNYRHFEKDLDPFNYAEKSFARLDRIINLCEKYGIYVILDLHSVQGWQNGDWHCDNSSRHALFWGHAQFQDRFVALWEELARRYKSRGVVAGYNLINEPVTNAENGRFLPDSDYMPNWDILNKIYKRTVDAIRIIDPNHIIFLEGDYFSLLFSKLDPPFTDNLVYSSHNYIPPTFADAKYPGTNGEIFWNYDKILDEFLSSEGHQFASEYNTPLWVGEFGVGGEFPHPNFQDKVNALDDQLSIYQKLGIHWTSWAYKSAGLMSWIQTEPTSEYNRTIQPVLDAKSVLRPDYGWLGEFPRQYEEALQTIEKIILENIPNLDPRTNRLFFRQAATSTYTADAMQPFFAEQFKDKTETQLESILESFSFGNCIHRVEMVDVFRKYMQ